MIYQGLLVTSLGLMGVLAWAQYRVAVVLLAALLPLYLLRFSVGSVPTNWWELGVLIVGVAAACIPRERARIRAAVGQLPRAFWWWLALWLLACGISVSISAETRVSLGILKGWILIPLLFAVQILGISAHDARMQRRILRGVVTGAVAVASLAVPALLTGERASSVYDVPNSLALYIAPLLAIALWLSRSATVASRLGWQGASFVLMLGLLATQSLAAVGAVVVTLAVGFWCWGVASGRVRHALILLGVLGIVMGYWQVTGRVAYFAHSVRQGVPTSLDVRAQLWSVGGELIRRHPVWGVGLGQFEPAYQQVVHERFQRYHAGETGTPPLPEFVFRDPHNWVIAWWLNAGALGLISFTALNVIAIRRAWHSPPLHMQAVLLGLLTITLYGLVDTVYWKNDLAALHWLLLAILIASREKAPLEPRQDAVYNNDHREEG